MPTAASLGEVPAFGVAAEASPLPADEHVVSDRSLWPTDAGRRVGRRRSDHLDPSTRARSRAARVGAGSSRADPTTRSSTTPGTWRAGPAGARAAVGRRPSRSSSPGPLVARCGSRRPTDRRRSSMTYRLTAGRAARHRGRRRLARGRAAALDGVPARRPSRAGDVRHPVRARPAAHACQLPWDAAKFEVCAHRFVDVSEPSFGVAVLNDGRYGHALQGDAVRVPALRAARHPGSTGRSCATRSPSPSCRTGEGSKRSSRRRRSSTGRRG